MADVTQGLPPLFAGRYAGAPFPPPQPPAPPPPPPVFVPRYSTAAPGTTSGALPTFQPAAPPPAVSAQPIDTAALNASTGPAITPANAASVPAAPAPTAQATPAAPAFQPLPPTAVGTAVASLPAYTAPQNGNFTDPGAAIKTGYRQQLDYQQSALSNIMDAARAGNPNNYSFRLAHLVGAMGNNNFGQVQGQGADALNQSIAGVSSAGINANAQIYGADQGVAARQAETGERATEFAGTPREVGNDVTYNQFGLPQGSRTTFATPAAGFIQPPGTQQQAAKPKEGATGKTPDGRAVVYRNGSWTAAQ